MAEGRELDSNGGYPQKELYIDTMEMSNKLSSESSILIDLMARFFLRQYLVGEHLSALYSLTR